MDNLVQEALLILTSVTVIIILTIGVQNLLQFGCKPSRIVTMLKSEMKKGACGTILAFVYITSFIIYISGIIYLLFSIFHKLSIF